MVEVVGEWDWGLCVCVCVCVGGVKTALKCHLVGWRVGWLVEGGRGRGGIALTPAP